MLFKWNLNINILLYIFYYKVKIFKYELKNFEYVWVIECGLGDFFVKVFFFIGNCKFLLKLICI